MVKPGIAEHLIRFERDGHHGDAVLPELGADEVGVRVDPGIMLPVIRAGLDDVRADHPLPVRGDLRDVIQPARIGVPERRAVRFGELDRTRILLPCPGGGRIGAVRRVVDFPVPLGRGEFQSDRRVVEPSGVGKTDLAELRADDCRALPVLRDRGDQGELLRRGLRQILEIVTAVLLHRGPDRHGVLVRPGHIPRVEGISVRRGEIGDHVRQLFRRDRSVEGPPRRGEREPDLPVVERNPPFRVRFLDADHLVFSVLRALLFRRRAADQKALSRAEDRIGEGEGEIILHTRGPVIQREDAELERGIARVGQLDEAAETRGGAASPVAVHLRDDEIPVPRDIHLGRGHGRQLLSLRVPGLCVHADGLLRGGRLLPRIASDEEHTRREEQRAEEERGAGSVLCVHFFHSIGFPYLQNESLCGTDARPASLLYHRSAGKARSVFASGEGETKIRNRHRRGKVCHSQNLYKKIISPL